VNRIDRLVGIVLFLQGRRVCRAEDIAAHFETSLRTVYRDIAALGEAGVPIVSEAGVGYSLRKGYHLPPVCFTAEEASALATGGALVEQMTDASLASAMRSALVKIRAVLPREEQDRVARVERGTLVRHVRNRLADDSKLLVSFQEALAKGRVLRLEYRAGRTSEPTTRDVEPLGLTHYFQHWHLIAWCRLRGDFRDFRLDRIATATLLPETFAPREDFHIADYFARMEAGHTSGVRARIFFEARAVDRARREWSLGLVEEAPSPEGGATLTLAADALEWFVCWLLSFGAASRVIEPEELRTLVVQAAENAANHHRATPC
jgi:predicted DNA-binding transcriptional regulator YafY